MSDRINIGTSGDFGLPLSAQEVDFDSAGMAYPHDGKLRFVQHKDHFTLEQWIDGSWEEVPVVVRGK